MSEKPIVAFYHKDCVDGTTSAAVVLNKFPYAKVFPVGFDTAAVDFAVAKSEITGETKVIFVDISVGLEEIMGLASEILVIDHHISEKERVEELVKSQDTITYIFDIAESGASLAFKYFFPEETVPTLVRYVQDIDLWNNIYVPKSSWLHQYMSTLRNQPDRVLPLLGAESDVEKYIALGKVLADYVDLEVTSSIERDPLYISFAEYKVPAFNITEHQSKAGNILSLKTNKAVIMYTIKGEHTRLSIRSSTGCVPNALAVAQFFGGGGHDHAAGATVVTETFLALLKA